LEKTNLTTFVPLEKICENPLVAPPGKNPSDGHGSTEYVLCPCFNALPDIFAVMNCSILALSAVFCSGFLT